MKIGLKAAAMVRSAFFPNALLSEPEWTQPNLNEVEPFHVRQHKNQQSSSQASFYFCFPKNKRSLHQFVQFRPKPALLSILTKLPMKDMQYGTPCYLRTCENQFRSIKSIFYNPFHYLFFVVFLPLYCPVLKVG